MIRQLDAHEVLLAVGGDCGCRRCRDMQKLKEDAVDLLKGLWDGFIDGF